MQLVEAKSDTCHLCLEEPIDKNREDNLCADCGEIADKYNQTAEYSEYLEEDDDCGCG